MGAIIRIIVKNMTFAVSLYDNSTAEAILAMLPITMNSNLKYYNLPNSIPSTAVILEIIRNGDIMLYGTRTFVLFYETSLTSYK